MHFQHPTCLSLSHKSFLCESVNTMGWNNEHQQILCVCERVCFDRWGSNTNLKHVETDGAKDNILPNMMAESMWPVKTAWILANELTFTLDLLGIMGLWVLVTHAAAGVLEMTSVT